MQLTLERATSQLIVSPGFAQPVTMLRQSYGESSRIEIHDTRDGLTVVPTELEEFAFVVKAVGKYAAAAPILAGCETFVWDAAISRWVGEIDYNVPALTDLLFLANPPTDQEKYLLLSAQLIWRVNSSAGQQRSQVIEQFYLDNTIWKGPELFPSTGTPIESAGSPFLTPMVRAIATGVANATTSYVDVTDYKFPVEAGKTYHFKFSFPFTTSGTAKGASFSLTGPTKSLLHYISRWSNAETTEIVRVSEDYDDATAATTTAAATGNYGTVEGHITVTASGYVTLRSKSVSSSTVTVLAGASVQYTKVD